MFSESVDFIILEHIVAFQEGEVYTEYVNIFQECSLKLLRVLHSFPGAPLS